MIDPEPDLREQTPGTADFSTWVRQTLGWMRTPQHDTVWPALHTLCLVQRIADHLDFLPGEWVYQHALEYLLAALIAGGLAHHRRVMGLPPAGGTETRQQALEALNRDMRTGNRELLSWSVLYYYYVRVDLDFTSPQLGQAVNMDERTLRRYRQLGSQRLADWLLRAEFQSRLGGPDTRLNDLFADHPLDRVVDLDVLLASLPTHFDRAATHPRLIGSDT